MSRQGAAAPQIRELLEERGRGEQLVVFDAARYDSWRSYGDLMRGVAAVVGPHGGAMYAVGYAPPADTLVVEFMVEGWWGVMNWEAAALGGLRYWATVHAAEGPTGADLIVDVAAVVGLLRSELGRPGAGAAGSPLQADYPWSAAGMSWQDPQTVG